MNETPGAPPATLGWWADRTMLPRQLPAADSYEACQRRPGDFEAQVGQRPVAVHDLEHLGATDREVIIFRQQIRREIRAVQAGQDPQGVCRDGGVVPTYCNDTVVRVPAAATLDEDRGLLCTTGRALAESYLRERCPSGSRHDREPVGFEERRFRWRWSAADELGTHRRP